MRMHLGKKLVIGGLLWLASVAAAPAALQVAAPVFDHAVLQRGRPVPIRGSANKGEKITVRFANQTKTATADGAGNWSVRLDPLEAGGPWTLTIQGDTTLTIQNVLVGEVWLCYDPLYKSMEVKDGKIVVSFDCQESKPAVRGGGNLEGFAIAGADQKFVWADAAIDGGRVIVSSPAVKAPVAVRYSWAINPRGNLINTEGLPASPFRTDAWAR